MKRILTTILFVCAASVAFAQSISVSTNGTFLVVSNSPTDVSYFSRPQLKSMENSVTNQMFQLQLGYARADQELTQIRIYLMHATQWGLKDPAPVAAPQLPVPTPTAATNAPTSTNKPSASLWYGTHSQATWATPPHAQDSATPPLG